MLQKYNELSIQFIIHFIINSTFSNINKSYEDSLNIFKTELENYKKSKLELINKKGNYITLNIFEEEENQTVIIRAKNNNNYNYNYKKNNGEITYVYPLLEPKDIELHYSIYSDQILKLIKLIILSKKQIINIYSKFDVPHKLEKNKLKLNIKSIISIQIMRFIYRHQGFNGKIFYISDPRKYGDSIQKITNSFINENKKNNNPNRKTTIIEKINIAFIIINNYDKILKRKEEKINLDNLPIHFKYLIISKNPIGENNKIFSYELKLTKEDIKEKGEKNKKSNNSNKDKKENIDKTDSKNKSYNKNKRTNSYESSPKTKINENNTPLKIRKYSTDKEKQNNNEIRSKTNNPSEFTILENKLFYDSNSSSNDSSESPKNSDFEEDF